MVLLAFFSHTPCGGDDQGCERALLDFDYSGRAFSVLFSFHEIGGSVLGYLCESTFSWHTLV